VKRRRRSVERREVRSEGEKISEEDMYYGYPYY